MDETPAISFENVSFSYGTTRVVSDVDLRVNPGEMIALVGENGSGKSTLLRLACGLLSPDSGEVKVFGHSTTENRGFPARRQCGVVFQNPDDQIVASIVENEVAFGPENLGLPREEIRRRVTQSLASVGLSGFEQRQTHSLSGGQKQRLALAGALAMQPRVLLLDEASSMLDPEAREELMQNIRRLHQDGMTILMATHDLTEANQATRVIEMRDGKISEDSPIEESSRRGSSTSELSNEEPFFDAASHCGKANDVISLTPPTKARTSPSQTLLEFRNASYDYDDDGTPRSALIDICTTLEQGEFLAIIGPTGSGKSTLIQHMNGLLHPTRGQVLLRGDSTNSKETTDRARRTVGLVMQYPENQLFAPTVYEDVAFGPKNLGLSDEEIDSRVHEALGQVGLPVEQFADRNPFHLSGGQQRRAAIAGILAMRPTVLALDEPCAGLDPTTHKMMTQLLKDLHSAGQTIVMITHDMEDARSLATRILHMQDGRIVYSN